MGYDDSALCGLLFSISSAWLHQRYELRVPNTKSERIACKLQSYSYKHV
jgi:hypothetical protein